MKPPNTHTRFPFLKDRRWRNPDGTKLVDTHNYAPNHWSVVLSRHEGSKDDPIKYAGFGATLRSAYAEAYRHWRQDHFFNIYEYLPNYPRV